MYVYTHNMFCFLFKCLYIYIYIQKMLFLIPQNILHYLKTLLEQFIVYFTFSKKHLQYNLVPL